MTIHTLKILFSNTHHAFLVCDTCQREIAQATGKTKFEAIGKLDDSQYLVQLNGQPDQHRCNTCQVMRR